MRAVVAPPAPQGAHRALARVPSRAGRRRVARRRGFMSRSDALGPRGRRRERRRQLRTPGLPTSRPCGATCRDARAGVCLDSRCDVASRHRWFGSHARGAGARADGRARGTPLDAHVEAGSRNARVSAVRRPGLARRARGVGDAPVALPLLRSRRSAARLPLAGDAGTPIAPSARGDPDRARRPSRATRQGARRPARLVAGAFEPAPADTRPGSAPTRLFAAPACGE